MVGVLEKFVSSYPSWALVSITSLLKMIVLFLIFTIVIATVTLIERKVLSLVQRRVGPNYIGYRGRLQFIADALKMLLKHIAIVNKTNRLLFICIPALILIVSYLFWANIVWMPNLAICEIEYNVIFLCLISSAFSYLLILVGYTSNNKYAMMSSTRVLVIGINLELLLTFLMLTLAILSEALSFEQIASWQANGKWNFMLFLPIMPIVIITFLLETSRIPFDLTEAESELIAGYTTEFGGFYFALFYLGEYFHLFTFCAVYATCFFGAWY
jgi:NADH:ubiquinone oxidoreductase subunit H